MVHDNVSLAGSYPRLIRLYTFVPLTSLVTWLLLGVVIPLAFIPRQPHHPHPKFFPSPLPEFITSAALWSFSYQLRLPLFSLISSAVKNPSVAVILHASSHVVVYNLLRLAVLPILGIRNDIECAFPTRSDHAFFRVWWVSLGWSFVEVIVAIWQGYEQLALYRDIMIPPSRVKEFLRAAVPPEEQDFDEISVADLAACKSIPTPSYLLYELMADYQPQTSCYQYSDRITRMMNWNRTWISLSASSQEKSWSRCMAYPSL